MKNVVIPMEELVPLLQLQMESAGQAWLTVTGGSMMPMLYHRKDRVRLEPVQELKKGDLILYLRHSGAYVLHRILKVKGDQLICCGDNQFRTELIDKDQVLAVVAAFTRKGKQFTVQDRGYRRYVALWVGLHPLRWLYLAFRRVLGRLRAALRRMYRRTGKRKQSA